MGREWKASERVHPQKLNNFSLSLKMMSHGSGNGSGGFGCGGRGNQDDEERELRRKIEEHKRQLEQLARENKRSERGIGRAGEKEPNFPSQAPGDHKFLTRLQGFFARPHSVS